MHSGTILFVKKGQLPPDNLLQKILEENTSFNGCAFAEGGEILIALDDEAATLEDVKTAIMQAIKDRPDKTMIFFFGKYPDGFLDEDMQPYPVLRNSKDEVIMVAFLEGKFPQYSQPNSNHSDAYFCAFKHIMPTLYKSYVAAGSSVPKLMESLDDDATKMSLTNMLGTDGTIVLLAGNGEAVMANKGNSTMDKEFKWGYTSNTYGVVEAEYPEKEEPKVPEKKTMQFGKIKPKAAASADITYTNIKTPTTATAAPPTVAMEKVMWSAQELNTRNLPKGTFCKQYRDVIKKGYKVRANFCPPNWRELPEVEVTNVNFLKPTLTATSSAASKTVATEKTPATNTTTGATSNVTVASKEGQVTQESFVPSPADISYLVDDFLKKKDVADQIQKHRLTVKAQGSSLLAIDPTELKKDAERNVPFYATAGLNSLDETMNFSRAQLYAMGQGSLTDLVNFAADWKAKCLLMMHAKAPALATTPAAKPSEPAGVAAVPPKFGRIKNKAGAL